MSTDAVRARRDRTRSTEARAETLARRAIRRGKYGTDPRRR